MSKKVTLSLGFITLLILAALTASFLNRKDQIQAQSDEKLILSSNIMTSSSLKGSEPITDITGCSDDDKIGSKPCIFTWHYRLKSETGAVRPMTNDEASQYRSDLIGKGWQEIKPDHYIYTVKTNHLHSSSFNCEIYLEATASAPVEPPTGFCSWTY